MSLIIKDVFIDNEGDLGGRFTLTISGPEESVLKYMENIDDTSFYFSAHIIPSIKDENIMREIDERHQRLMENYNADLMKGIDEVKNYLHNLNPGEIVVHDVDNFISSRLISNYSQVEAPDSEVKIMIDPDFEMDKADNIVFSISNGFADYFSVSTGYSLGGPSEVAEFKISDSPYAQNVRALAEATATISSTAHLYVLNGSSGKNEMSASADPDSSLNIGIELYRNRNEKLFGADHGGAGVAETINGKDEEGKNNWKFKVYQSSARGGNYTYDTKWSRT